VAPGKKQVHFYIIPVNATNVIYRFETGPFSSLYIVGVWNYQWKGTCPAICKTFEVTIYTSCKLNL